MNSQAYLLLAYIISLALLWGCAGSWWLRWRTLGRRVGSPPR